MDLVLEIGWRVLNSLLATMALIALIAKTLEMWDRYTERMRLLAMSLALFLLTTVYGSIEQIIQGGDFGFRVALTTVALAWTLHALLRAGEGYTRDDPYSTSKYDT